MNQGKKVMNQYSKCWVSSQEQDKRATPDTFPSYEITQDLDRSIDLQSPRLFVQDDVARQT